MATMKGTTRLLLELRGDQPTKLTVHDVSSIDVLHGRAFGIVADYGWAERIVCSVMSREDANDVAHAMAGRIGCAAELAGEGG